MGYESKVYIVERHEHNKTVGGEPIDPPIINSIVLASYDLCKMGGMDFAPEFYNAFKKEIDYKLWLPSFDDYGNETTADVDEDCYGEHMKSANIDELIEALKVCEQRDHYRRIPPLVAMLEAFAAEKDEWNELQVVHYGY